MQPQPSPIVDGPHQHRASSRSAATAGRRWARSPGFDTLGGMAALRCPVLMLYGEHFIYGRHRALLQAKCPQAKVEIVPGGGGFA